MNRCSKLTWQEKKYLTLRSHKHFASFLHMRIKFCTVSPLTCRAGGVGNNLSITGQYKRCAQTRCHFCVWLSWWITRLENSVFGCYSCILFLTLFEHTVDEHGRCCRFTGAAINCDTRVGIQDCDMNFDGGFLPRWYLLGHKFRLFCSCLFWSVYADPLCCVCAWCAIRSPFSASGQWSTSLWCQRGYTINEPLDLTSSWSSTPVHCYSLCTTNAGGRGGKHSDAVVCQKCWSAPATWQWTSDFARAQFMGHC